MEKEIEGRNVTLTPEWKERLEQEMARIEEHHPDVVHRLRVCIAASKHQRLGLFEINLLASVPQDAVVVKDKGEFVLPLIVDSFEVLDRRLKDFTSRRQQLVKRHEAPPVGTVTELWPMEDYGRVTDEDGSLVYFHRNSVKGCKFDELHEGDFVEFREEMGDMGPQAVWVKRR